jgi:diguanylate cyclase (GGDEF)-like protein
VRSSVAAATIHLDGGTMLTVTVSVGGSLSPPGESDNLLREADLRLYTAKAAGRNRVVVSEEPASTAGSRLSSGGSGW